MQGMREKKTKQRRHLKRLSLCRHLFRRFLENRIVRAFSIPFWVPREISESFIIELTDFLIPKPLDIVNWKQILMQNMKTF